MECCGRSQAGVNQIVSTTLVADPQLIRAEIDKRLATARTLPVRSSGPAIVGARSRSTSRSPCLNGSPSAVGSWEATSTVTITSSWTSTPSIAAPAALVDQRVHSIEASSWIYIRLALSPVGNWEFQDYKR